MIAAIFNIAQNYARPASTYTSGRVLTPTDALPDAVAPTDQTASSPGIPVSQLRPVYGAKVISASDIPELRDSIATNWLMMHDTSTQSDIPDNAPQNVFAQVKVNGKVVATLYNSGGAALTNAAGAQVSGLQDPPGLAGPNLAQWRADNYAKLLGGTVEKASTAIAQSQWTPRESIARTYNRAQLDAAYEATLAEGRKATAPAQAGSHASVSA